MTLSENFWIRRLANCLLDSCSTNLKFAAYFKFIHKLKQDAARKHLQLHQISHELLLLVVTDQSIQVRTIRKLAHPIEHDELLPREIAGY